MVGRKMPRITLLEEVMLQFCKMTQIEPARVKMQVTSAENEEQVRNTRVAVYNAVTSNPYNLRLKISIQQEGDYVLIAFMSYEDEKGKGMKAEELYKLISKHFESSNLKYIKISNGEGAKKSVLAGQKAQTTKQKPEQTQPTMNAVTTPPENKSPRATPDFLLYVRDIRAHHDLFQTAENEISKMEQTITDYKLEDLTAEIKALKKQVSEMEAALSRKRQLLTSKTNTISEAEKIRGRIAEMRREQEAFKAGHEEYLEVKGLMAG